MNSTLRRPTTTLEAYSFDVTIHSIQLSLSLGVVLYFMLSRRNKKAETKTPVRLVPGILQSNVSQSLQLVSALVSSEVNQLQSERICMRELKSQAMDLEE